MRYQATHDLLTRLPNERLLEEYIESEIKVAEQNQQMFAVFFVGLNEMDRINDGLGHQASALTVQIVAKRLKNFFSKHGIVINPLHLPIACMAKVNASAF